MVNTLGFAMLYPLVRSDAFVVVADGGSDPDRYAPLAHAANNGIGRDLVSGVAVYFVCNAAFNGYGCVRHAGYQLRRRRASVTLPSGTMRHTS
jgi:hypothetical protein